MKIITNNESECQGLSGAQGVVSTHITDANNEYASFQTKGVTDCLGIGVRVTSADGKIKQVGLYHSLSEHDFDKSRKSQTQEKMSKHVNKSDKEREALLKDKNMMYKRGAAFDDNEYTVCAIAQLLSTVSNGDTIKISLHGGDTGGNLKIAEAQAALKQWVNCYIEAKGLDSINLEFEVVHPPGKGSTFFAIDSNGENYIKENDYKESLLVRQLMALKDNIELNAKNNSLDMGIRDNIVKREIAIDDKNYIVPRAVKEAYGLLTETLAKPVAFENQGKNIQYLESQLGKCEAILNQKHSNCIQSAHAPSHFSEQASYSQKQLQMEFNG
ncbi:hypothetical protein L3V83_06075 [Thiotrichales bacterium 19X7-9]|nr:hypothetical protein [Thiotrichales bacterium 19X7-9]